MKVKLIIFVVILSFFLLGVSQAAIVDSNNTFRIDLDFSSETPAPPYTTLQFRIDFGSADILDAGEGYTYQVLDSSDNPASISYTFILPSGTSSSVITALPLNPSPNLYDGLASVIFTDIIGSFDLISGRGLARTNSESTSYVQGDLSISEVPIPGAVWLLGSGLIGIIGYRRQQILKY